MNHNWIKKNLVRFIDNDLSEPEKSLFTDHLSKCDSCRNDYQYVSSLFKKEKKSYTVPESLWFKVYGSLETKGKELSVIDSGYGFGRRYSFVLLLLLSIMIGTFFGNKIFFNDSKSANSMNLTEEYYPSDNVFKPEISGLGR